MKTNEFYIIVQPDKVLLNWGNQQGIPYRLATGLEKDRLIARILHKMLNMRLSEEEEGVFGREEFKVLGATLFNLLFSDEALRMHFDTFYKEAIGSPAERHRLILEFDRQAEEMAMLPWEYLYYESDERHEAFLAAHPKKCIDLVRKLPFGGSWLEMDKTQQHIAPPLRVLLIAALPNVQTDTDDAKETFAYFQKLIERFPDTIEIRVLSQPEVDIFANQLNAVIQNPGGDAPFFPHIIHFIGRSRVNGDTGELCFVRKNATEQYTEHWINEDTFAGYFEEWNRLPHLVFLHVCDGVRIGNYNKDKGVAVKLVKKGIPFVIALQNPVLNRMGQILVEKVYDSLLNGDDVEAAVTEGRFFLARKLMDGSGNLYGNYDHKIFGSVVIFSSVLRPFALDIATSAPAATPTLATGQTYKTCLDHPDKKYNPTDNWCSFCGKKLLFPSETPDKPASNTDTPPTSRDASTPSPSKRAHDHKPDRDASPAPSSRRSSEQPVVLTETRSTSVTMEAILDLERQGLKKQLEILIRRLNALRSDFAIINDPSQRFTVGEQIRLLEEEVEDIKNKLNNRAL